MSHATTGANPEWADSSIPDTELSPRSLSRRTMLRNAGVIGAGVGGLGLIGQQSAAAADGRGSAKTEKDDEYVYLALKADR